MMVIRSLNDAVTPRHIHWLVQLVRASITLWILVSSPEGHHASPDPMLEMTTLELEYREQLNECTTQSNSLRQ